VLRRAGSGLALCSAALLLAACGGGGGGGAAPTTTPSPDAVLRSAGATVQAAMATYQHAVPACATQSSPVVCLEAADRTLGDKIHHYANVLAGHQQFRAPRAALTAALNSAQTLANSLEILGDAQPTQANYDQVQNTFNVSAAVTALQGDVATLNGSLGR
jgi:hypothetical protein